jgi:tRNA uridine 5-carboxymethylaminomethyl modification enzyme
MFTSRAEHRILLRQDNADIRLTPLVKAIGMHNLEERMSRVEAKLHGIEKITAALSTLHADPDQVNPLLERSSPITQKTKLDLILSRPHIAVDELIPHVPALQESLREFDAETISLAEVNIKYRGYIEREQDMVNKISRLDELILHDGIDYSSINSLSHESREKLARLKPRTIGQASRISGVSPSDISVLLVHMGR